MASPTQVTQVSYTTDTPASTAAQSKRVTTGWPVGDVLYKSLLMRIRTNMSAAGALVTGGRLAHLQSLYLQTDKHGPIVEGVDGWMLMGMLHMLNPIALGAYFTSTQDGVLSFRLPFERFGGARPADTRLDMLKARPDLQLSFRAGAAIETGAGQVDNLDVAVHAEIDPGPVNPDADGPTVMPHLQALSFSGLSAGKQVFELPYGDRTYLGIVIRQCVAASGVPVNDTVVGAAASDSVSVKLNGFPYMDRVLFRTIKDMNRVDYAGFDGVWGSLGVTFLDFQRFRSGGRMLSEALVTNSPTNGRLTLEVDTAAFGSNALQLGLVSVKPIPAAARRPAPEPAK